MATVIRRSRNSYIRSPRRVTLAPIGMSSRTRKPAMEFLALVMTACWPAIVVRSSWADLAFLLSFTEPLQHRSRCSERSCPDAGSACRSCSRTLLSSRHGSCRDTASSDAGYSLQYQASDHVPRGLGKTHLLAVFNHAEADAGGFAVACQGMPDCSGSIGIALGMRPPWLVWL